MLKWSFEDGLSIVDLVNVESQEFVSDSNEVGEFDVLQKINREVIELDRVL